MYCWSNRNRQASPPQREWGAHCVPWRRDGSQDERAGTREPIRTHIWEYLSEWWILLYCTCTRVNWLSALDWASHILARDSTKTLVSPGLINRNENLMRIFGSYHSPHKVKTNVKTLQIWKTFRFCTESRRCIMYEMWDSLSRRLISRSPRERSATDPRSHS